MSAADFTDYGDLNRRQSIWKMETSRSAGSLVSNNHTSVL